MAEHHHQHDDSHSHWQDHPHHHVQEGHDYAKHNEQFFDEFATKYNSFSSSMGHDMAVRTMYPALRKAYEFDKEKTRVLDFACGTGLVSIQLMACSKEIVGVDISQGMVDQFNASVSKEGISPESMHAIRLNVLEADAESGPMQDLINNPFDVIVCAAAYHHFSDILATTIALSKLLKPGGALLVADIASLEGKEDTFGLASPERAHVVAHNKGFKEQDIKVVFEKAGLGGNWDWNDDVKVLREGKEVGLFVARGVKV